MHDADCPAVGTTTLERCPTGSTCAKRYAEGSLEKGFVSKLKCAMSETLGKSDPWNEQEKRGNPVDSAAVRAYIAHVRVEQRRVGVIVQQARAMLSPVLLEVVRYLRRSARQLTTVRARVERSRDIALFVTAFHTAQRGFDLSHALAAQVLSLPKGEGLIFNFHFGKTLRSSSHAVVARRDRDCNELCPVRAVQEFALVTKHAGWPPREGYLFPQVDPDGSRGSSPWTAHDMSSRLQAAVSAAGLADGRKYSMHSFRVGGAVSQALAGTAVDALMAHVGWKTKSVARRYVGPQPSVAGVPPPSGRQPASRLPQEARYQAAIDLPLQTDFEKHFAAFG